MLHLEVSFWSLFFLLLGIFFFFSPEHCMEFETYVSFLITDTCRKVL